MTNTQPPIGDTETLRDGEYRETKDMDETNESPSRCTRVTTIPQAVELSLKDGLGKNSLYDFSRALRAFEVTTGVRLDSNQLGSAFSLWWNTAKPVLPKDADFDEWRYDFEACNRIARVPLGANPLEQALRAAQTGEPPAEAIRYTSQRIRLLVAVCYHLQLLTGSSPFFLSVRDAARIMRLKDLHKSAASLNGLVGDGILLEVARGKPGHGRATRFRFNSPQFTANAPQSVEPEPDPPIESCKPEGSTQAARDTPKYECVPSSTEKKKQPSTYELVEKKKACEALLASEFGQIEPHQLFGERQERYGRLKAQIHELNQRLSGIPETHENGSNIFEQMRNASS